VQVGKWARGGGGTFVDKVRIKDMVGSSSEEGSNKLRFSTKTVGLSPPLKVHTGETPCTRREEEGSSGESWRLVNNELGRR
jgi:hypothetical protein